MRTNVQETSIETYHSDRMRSRDLTIKLIHYGLNNKRFTCKMAAAGLDVDASTLSGIINNTLIKQGVFRRELNKHPCCITGNNAFWLYHVDYTPQGVLI